MTERDLEQEHFAREDREKLAKLKAKLEAQAAAAALDERRKAHLNRCGKCGGSMSTHPYRGIEIEICDECGAVLLDPGELELLAGKDQGGVVQGLMGLLGRR